MPVIGGRKRTSLICSEALASVQLHNQATDADDAAVCGNNQLGPVKQQPGHFLTLVAIKHNVAALPRRINTAPVGRSVCLLLYSDRQLCVCACECISCCHQGQWGIKSDKKGFFFLGF